MIMHKTVSITHAPLNGKSLSAGIGRPRLATRLAAGLCLLLAAAASSAAVTNLIDASAWRIYGSGSVQGSTLTVGDNIGYDKPDVDKDGNPYNIWFGGTSPSDGQGVDYDEAVTVSDFSPPFKLVWSGCFPSTSYGYNNIFIGRKNPLFTGKSDRQYLINQEFGYTARWDYSGLNTMVSGDVQKITTATASNNNFCGNYRIDWSNDQLDFYYNGTKVRSQRYVFLGPVSIVVRSFERPHSITSMTIEPLVTTTQKPATGQGLASVYGANISGTITDSTTGQVTALNSSYAAVSGDVSFAYNEQGNLIARVTGVGAALGAAFRYAADYDVITQNLTGTVTDNATNATRPITFTNKGGLVWDAHITAGTGYNSNGKPVTYDLSYTIVLPQQSIISGSKFPKNGRMNVDLGRTQQVSIPISIPAPVNFNTTLTTNIITEGAIVVTLVPLPNGGVTVTGNLQGSFRMDPPLQVTTQFTPSFGGFTVPPVDITVTVDATGRFSGVLTGDTRKNDLRFTGNWSSVSSDGATAGGTLDMPIPLDPKTGAVPSSAQLSIIGTVTAPVHAGNLPSQVPAGIVPSSTSVPFSQQVTIPIVFE